jgi:hypothetical protein
LGAAFLNQVSILIENFSMPGDDSSAASGLRLQRKYGGQGVNRVPKDDGAVKFPFENGQKRECVDTRRLAHQARGDRQAKQSMSHWPAERVALGRRMINMKRIEIARQSCEEDNISFGDGSPWALPLITDREIIK